MTGMERLKSLRLRIDGWILKSRMSPPFSPSARHHSDLPRDPMFTHEVRWDLAELFEGGFKGRTVDALLFILQSLCRVLEMFPAAFG
jgi:hypothetical protein